MEPAARQLYRLVEPIHMVTYFSAEPTAALMALGHRNYWDGYFAGRAAPLGRVPAEVVHAIFYNFADGEVSRHIPRVWDTATPEEALAARERGSVAALRRILGELADAPALWACWRPRHQGGDERADGGTGPVCRAESPSRSRRARGPPLACGHPAPRAPRRRAYRRLGRLGHRRDGSPRAARSVRGHARREVRQSPPPPPGAADRGRGRDAGPRPHRRLRLAQ